MDISSPPGEGSAIPLKHARILRGPTQVAFDITNRCNLKCRHCYNRSAENAVMNDELSDREVKRLVRDLAYLRPYNVCFCGGETLLRLDLLCQSARELRKNGVQVSMVSNGWFLTQEVAHRLLDAGVTRVQISVDGATPESHAFLRVLPQSFERATQALDHLKAAGVPEIGVAFTPTRNNCHQVADAYRLCKRLGAGSFRIQPLMALGRASQELRSITPTPWQYRELLWSVNELRHTEGASIEWGDPIDHLLRFSSIAQHCISFVTIQANGDIPLSPYLPVSVGNLRRHSLREYWEKGLARLWEWELPKSFARRIKCMDDLGERREGLPSVWFDESLKFDLIDDPSKLTAPDLTYAFSAKECHA
jgi:MoaA/NifB/PqqE/SkfB family radical SAM enzyme